MGIKIEYTANDLQYAPDKIYKPQSKKINDILIDNQDMSDEHVVKEVTKYLDSTKIRYKRVISLDVSKEFMTKKGIIVYIESEDGTSSQYFFTVREKFDPEEFVELNKEIKTIKGFTEDNLVKEIKHIDKEIKNNTENE